MDLCIRHDLKESTKKGHAKLYFKIKHEKQASNQDKMSKKAGGHLSESSNDIHCKEIKSLQVTVMFKKRQEVVQKLLWIAIYAPAP